MKKMSRKQRKMFLLCGGCAAVLLLAAGIVYGVTRFTSSGADTEEGIAYIKAAEAEDITVIEQKIARTAGRRIRAVPKKSSQVLW